MFTPKYWRFIDESAADIRVYITIAPDIDKAIQIAKQYITPYNRLEEIDSVMYESIRQRLIYQRHPDRILVQSVMNEAYFIDAE